MNLRLPLCLLTLLMLSASYNSVGQKAKHVGLTATLETSTSAFKPGVGLQYEQQFTRRSGLETGLFYRNYQQGLFVTISDGTNSVSSSINVSESHLSIPALYKFHTKIVNISAGPTFEFFMGWRQTNRDPVIRLDGYSMQHAFNIGVLTKLSKDIRLNERFILEPEVRLNPIVTNDRAYLGFGIAGKYRL
jgi:hypothetical protein